MANAGFISYDRLVDAALRSVVRDTLRHIATHGLQGPHHIYLTFNTGFEGVHIPDSLRAQYPDEMTIVLQHQFWGLEIEDHRFAVSLSFNKTPQRLQIPFAAITRFADPGVNFGLQFQATDRPAVAPSDAPSPPAAAGSEPAAAAPADEKIITLDSFRKK